MTYLLKGWKGKVHTVDEEDLRVVYEETYTREKRGSLPGLGPVYERKHKGWDRSRLRIVSNRALMGDGRKAMTGIGDNVEKTAAGLKTVLRRLRPQEAEAIAAIDERIQAALQHVAELRKERDATVRAAWTKANVVRLNELTIPEPVRP